MQVIDIKNKGPIFSWCPDIEPSAYEQVLNMRELPFATHVAVMADAHQGYGMPIGGILATQGVVIPNAVGVDIGCGMVSCKTSLTNISETQLKEILGLIREQIPLGFNHNTKPQIISQMKDETLTTIVKANYESARLQVCSLGGGKLIASVLVNCQ